MTKFWLIRHGEPVEEVRGRCYGSLDVGLSDTGRAQMARVAEFLKAEPIATIYASPLTRALESARILSAALSSPIEIVPDLQELNFGVLEGLAYDDIAAGYPDLYRQWMETPAAVHFPNGESLPEMSARVLRAFDTIRREREGHTVAIVSHGGVNRILLAWALEAPVGNLFRLAQDYAAVNLLTFVEGTPIVQLMNR